MADEDVKVEDDPKSKEEMRHIPHEYKDSLGWCAVCGRSEGFKIHLVEIPMGSEGEMVIEGDFPAPVAERAEEISAEAKQPKRSRKVEQPTQEPSED
jgi:hypothetical protein